MKNLKKVLALVLVVAMVMGLAITSNAAFSDGSTIKNTEAVDVVSSIGVINGFTDGTFKGTENVTRGQMAKMISFVMNSGDDVGDYYSSINAYTDCKTHWAKGYIAYCDKMGVVAGIGGGKFAPDASVTGAQAAKMLLVALGYDATNQGYTGTNWSTAVLKDAKDAGLLKDMGKVDMSAPLTRDNAAQMVFNALKATMVEYEDNGSSIVVGGITVNTKASKPTKVTGEDSKYNNVDTDTDKNNNKYVQLGEEYFEDLVKKSNGTNGTDNFGRSAHTWVNDKTTIGTYADSADQTQIVDKEKDLTVILTDDDYLNYDAATYTKIVSEQSTQVYPTVYLNGDKQTYSAQTDVKTVPGDIVETFENDDGEITNVVIVRYTVAKIDEIDTTLSSTYTKKGASCTISLTKLNDNFDTVSGYTYYDAHDDYDAKDNSSTIKVLAGFSADTYKEDTVLAVAVNAKSKVLDSYVATKAEGTISSYNKGDTAYVTLAGNKTYLNGEAKTAAAVTGFDYKDTSYSIYTDANSYVLGYDSTTETKLDDVYYVAGVIKDVSGTYSTATYYAQAVALKDGAVSNIKLEKDSFTGNSSFKAEDNTNYQTVGKLFTFTDSDGSKSDNSKSNNGKFWGEPYTGDTTNHVFEKDAIGDDLTKSDSSMKVGSQKVYLGSATNFVKVEDDQDDIAVTTVTGGTSVKKSGVTAIAVCTKSGSSYNAKYVVLISGDFATATDAGDVVYISDVSDDYTGDGWNTEVYYMDGTGKVETVVVDQKLAPTAGFYTFSVDDDGIYTLDSCEDNLTSGSSKLAANYDDETGFALNASNVSVYGESSLTAKLFTIPQAGEVAAKAIWAEDVSFTSNIKVIDERTDAQKDASKYSGDITSVGNLSSAAGKSDAENLRLNVYFDNGKVIFVAVNAYTAIN